MPSFNDFPLAKGLTEEVNLDTQGLENGEADILNKVSNTTADLLLWWFAKDYMELRDYNFHEGQRQAILNIIYAHEVLKCKTLRSLYSEVCPMALLEIRTAEEIMQQVKNQHPKYCMKMATGTGKTWVLSAILIWQVLNAKRDNNNSIFTRNFLLIAPGLIVYERLLNAFRGVETDGKRDFDQSDFKKYETLFIPDNYRDEVFSFIQNSVCDKEEIAKKTTGSGFIGITNWHAIMEEKEAQDDIENETIAEGQDIDYKKTAKDAIPLAPGKTESHKLEVLNNRFEKGKILSYLRDFPDLMVLNDEAHHIHGDDTKWQESLDIIAEPKKERFFQVDFSATPYKQKGNNKIYFPHIIMDFDIGDAIRKGYVKSLVLDKREEVGAIANDDLDFRSYRDGEAPYLSEGQRIMLRAGLNKLDKLAMDFKELDPDRHPKMLVVCEDTKITPLVEDFLKSEGLINEEILRIDSNRKNEVEASEWSKIRERLFAMDNHQNPRIIINVLMLREGFDVNNICVIVPLRAAGSQILLEQIIGRGLRLMWREGEYESHKKENRDLIASGKEPNSMIDILSIVEHPAFMEFYDDLRNRGLIGDDDGKDSGSTTGDLMPSNLIANYQDYDFAIPFIVREQQEELQQHPIDISQIPIFEGFKIEQLKGLIGKGDNFYSVELQSKTRFGDYRVDGGIMTATGYNDYLARLVKRVSEIMHPDLISSPKIFANKEKFPYLQINKPELAELLDRYIRTRLFGESFDPMHDENWRMLLIDSVSQHIVKVWSQKLLEAENSEITAEAEVHHRYLSEVKKLIVRESYSIPVNKCIYERLNFPSNKGGLEKKFIEACNRDASVEAFCRIHEKKHDFMCLRYIKEDGIPSHYHPDFLVRTKTHIYLTETKGTDRISTSDTIRKQIAAVDWCQNINNLDEEERSYRIWEYALLGQKTLEDHLEKGQKVEDILAYAKLRKPKESLLE